MFNIWQIVGPNPKSIVEVFALEVNHKSDRIWEMVTDLMVLKDQDRLRCF